MAKIARSTPDTDEFEPEQDTADAARGETLEKQFKASRSAFSSWEASQVRTDQNLYIALGRLAEFAAAVGNDHQALIDFAAKKGVRATKTSTRYAVAAKLIVTDRKKVNKYATVLQLAARRGIESTADSIAEFIKAEGGIEACLRSFRALPREPGRAQGGGRPSAFDRAVKRIAGLDRTRAPEELQTDTVSGEYFLIVGVRDADGTMHLLREPVTDGGLVHKAVVMVAPKA